MLVTLEMVARLADSDDLRGIERHASMKRRMTGK